MFTLLIKINKKEREKIGPIVPKVKWYTYMLGYSYISNTYLKKVLKRHYVFIGSSQFG